MTGIKTTPVNQSSEYKMENFKSLDKIGHLLEPSKYKDMTYYYMTHGTRRVTLRIGRMSLR